jgi:hypothetical protein
MRGDAAGEADSEGRRDRQIHIYSPKIMVHPLYCSIR